MCSNHRVLHRYEKILKDLTDGWNFVLRSRFRLIRYIDKFYTNMSKQIISHSPILKHGVFLFKQQQLIRSCRIVSPIVSLFVRIPALKLMAIFIIRKNFWI